VNSTGFNSNNYAIVGDTVYFRDRETEDLFGNHASGGNLMMQRLGSSTASQLLPYGDADNGGDLYTAGTSLVSVLTNFSGTGSNQVVTTTIRLHNASTGKISRVLFEDAPWGTFVSGDDALYQLVSDNGTYTVNRFPATGDATELLSITLDAGEQGAMIDEANGIITLASHGSYNRLQSIAQYTIATGDFTELPLQDLSGISARDLQVLTIA